MLIANLASVAEDHSLEVGGNSNEAKKDDFNVCRRGGVIWAGPRRDSEQGRLRSVGSTRDRRIGRHISVAQQGLAIIRKEAKRQGDKQTVTEVDRMTVELNASLKAYVRCKAHSAKAHINMIQLSKNAGRVTKSLESAVKIRAQVMKRLYPKTSSGADTEQRL